MPKRPPPRLALTPGEPAGIGPDVCIMLAQQPHSAELVAIADPDLLEERAQQLGLPLCLHEYKANRNAAAHRAGHLPVLPVPLTQPVSCGLTDPRNARYVLDTVTRAAHGCLEQEFDGMVTAPIHKGVINQAGIRFSGHTGLLAEICGGPEPVMMLTAPGLRVALTTIHIPLRDVPAAITPARLGHTLRVLHHHLVHRMGLAQPRILVCGLNPHAGEDGHIGNEEQLVIEPTLQVLRESDMDLIGPLPADSLFTPDKLTSADAVLAMYHDQGLPVLKHMGFGQAVNVTLGLPIIRTSVDHGTALDLAGTGRARAGSMEAAVREAIELCRHQQHA